MLHRSYVPAKLRTLIMAAIVATMASAAQADDAKRGQQLAEKHCARCHVVGDFNPTGGISSTPSFQLLVRRRPDWRDRYLTFYARRPHPAFVLMEGFDRLMPELPTNAAPVKLTLDDVDALVAFAATLKTAE
ncbi:MAG: cytochrome c [Pseudomonadota bacterium]